MTSAAEAALGATAEIATATLPPIDRSPTKIQSTPHRVNQRVLTPVVVCGSPCVLPSPVKEGQLLSPLLVTAAANNRGSGGSALLQNNVPASESEKLTATNIHVLREMDQPRPRPSDIEATVCPASVEPFRKAWWAGVRPTTCERTCRHRSKVCDAIQLCNDCTGYYCKWLAELVGIPVLKASGRVDPLLFDKDPLAKLYWERISKVACCPKVTAKCLMCIRRYQLFTHFLPGNLDFRSLVHDSVMKLHEEGFAVDMGLIRKVTRRHLECIADSMSLALPVEYMSSYHAYDIIVRRGPLVDVLANGLSSALQAQGVSPGFQSSGGALNSSNHGMSGGNPLSNYASVFSPSQKMGDSLQSPSSRSVTDVLSQTEQAIKDVLLKDTTLSTSDSSPRDSCKMKIEDGESGLKGSLHHGNSGNGLSDGILEEKTEGNSKRRSRRRVKRPVYSGVEEIYYGEDNDFLSLLEANEDGEDQESDDTDGERGRKKRRRGHSVRRMNSKGLTSTLFGLGLENQFSVDSARGNSTTTNNSSFDSLINQFQPSSINSLETPVDTEMFQMLCRSKNGRGTRQASREGMWVPNSAIKGAKGFYTSPFNGPSQINDHQSKFDSADGATETIDRLAAAFLQRFDSQRSRTQLDLAVTESVHRQQLAEETRLAECGVRGIFWDPSKEGWCVLLPLLATMTEEGLSSAKRRILCFSANTWKSFESAKWSAVYERLRRNPRELEFLTQDVRQDLSYWVRENIENTTTNCTTTTVGDEGQVTFGSGYNNDVDPHHQFDNSSQLPGTNPNGSSRRLVDLLGSLAKHIATLGNSNKDDSSHDTTTAVTSTTAAEMDDPQVTTTTGEDLDISLNSSGEILPSEKQFPSSILGILATLQSKLSLDQGPPSIQELKFKDHMKYERN